MRGLTAPQKRVLLYLKKRITWGVGSPTLAEIAKEFGWKSPNSAAGHIKALEAKGFIMIEPRVSRGIRVIGEG